MPLICSGSFSLLSFLPSFFLAFPPSPSLFHFSFFSILCVPENIDANGRDGTEDCVFVLILTVTCMYKLGLYAISVFRAKRTVLMLFE